MILPRKWSRSTNAMFRLAAAVVVLAAVACAANAQQRREREPNSVYAERRAKRDAQADAPIILFGYTGREESAQTYLFAEEDNFYYLSGHNEEGATLIILPAAKGEAKNGANWDGPREI